MTTRNFHSLSLLAICSLLLFGSCLQDKCERTQQYVRYDPVYLTAEGIRVNVSVDDPRDLKDPGNIYFYNDYLLVNERMLGIHVIDNRDPASPVNVAFIEIPGCRDMAVRNNILYADMFIDLVALDITDILHPELICRVENVFASYFPFDVNHGYIVEYVPTEVIEEIDCSHEYWDSWWWRGPGGGIWLSAEWSIDVLSFDAAGFSGQSSSTAPSVGIGGSMARFTLVNDYLYTLDMSEMEVFNVNGSCPEHRNTVEMRWGIETLFPYGQYLFVGSNSGMLIYDNTNQESPSYLAEFTHAQACDPVFVSNDIAYVTLRDGTPCQNFINQLDVIDVSTITNPQLIRSYPMQHPHGLSVVDQTLYLCEGRFGVKIYDVGNLQTITDHLQSVVDDLHAYDVIVVPQTLVAMVIGEDGLYQYDVSDSGQPVELSRIPVTH